MRNYFITGALIAIGGVIVRMVVNFPGWEKAKPLGWLDFFQGVGMFALILIGTALVGGLLGILAGWFLERDRLAKEKSPEAPRLPQ